MSCAIHWFRQDLRLSDNPALTEACKAGDEVLCIFIDDPADQTISRLGAASRVWLHHSLAALQQSLQKKGSALYLAQGDSHEVLESLVRQSGATRIFWNRCYDPATIERDKAIKSALVDLDPRSFNSLLLHEPWENLKNDGTAYRVYTPYWRSAAAALDRDASVLQTLDVPGHMPGLSDRIAGRLDRCVTLDQLQLLPEIDWHEGVMSTWTAGEHAGQAQLEGFLKSGVHDYDRGRDLPATDGTSRLSPHLHFGEISPRQVLSRLLGGRRISELSDDEETFAREIVWREFGYCLLYHFPHSIDEPLDIRFRRFRWARGTARHVEAWKRGQTGVPIVDAGMRQLYATGWMHNRVRMIVASYLIKNLLVSWQEGEHWFRDTLLDADLASNVMGWQWTAGSGADAAPFFRVFNPVLQGERFDADGDYVRQWVPELDTVPKRYIHKPWEMDEAARRGIDYPEPLVDLKQTRQRALDAFAEIKGTKQA